ncbi:MAG: hypothetical protein KDD61_04590 [Bdellovibrionales bacterium]|nr:hypothetical protein [Bdellovibrionales bacterium]
MDCIQMPLLFLKSTLLFFGFLGVPTPLHAQSFISPPPLALKKYDPEHRIGVPLTSQAFRYDHSVRLIPSDHDPLGESTSARLLMQMYHLGVRHIVVEIPSLLKRSSSRIYFGNQWRPGSPKGFSVFVAQAKSLNIEITLALKTYDESDEVIYSLSEELRESTLQSYVIFLRAYAQLAEKIGIEEVSIGTLLADLPCDNRLGFERILQQISAWYQGRLRMDFSDEFHFIRSYKCLKQNSSLFSSFAIHNSPVATVSIPWSALLPSQTLLFEVPLIGLYAQQKKVFSEMTDFWEKALHKDQWQLVFGSFYADRMRGGPYDESDALNSKKILEDLEQWYLKH